MKQQRALTADLDAMLQTLLWAEAVDLCFGSGLDRGLGLTYDEGVREEASLLADAWRTASEDHPRLTFALAAMRRDGWVERAAALAARTLETGE
jgi:hypothetical protein